jgi:hypothetical protein
MKGETMKYTLTAMRDELQPILSIAFELHLAGGHSADLFVCENPICALANAIEGVDVTAETFLVGNHEVTITVELED